MELINSAKKEQNNKHNPSAQEPQSAHATPVVEKYIKKRNSKAEKQIQHEENGKSL